MKYVLPAYFRFPVNEVVHHDDVDIVASLPGSSSPVLMRTEAMRASLNSTATNDRLPDAAGAGEIYVSRTIVDLVHGSGLEFVDRGVRDADGPARDVPMLVVAGL